MMYQTLQPARIHLSLSAGIICWIDFIRSVHCHQGSEGHSHFHPFASRIDTLTDSWATRFRLEWYQNPAARMLTAHLRQTLKCFYAMSTEALPLQNDWFFLQFCCCFRGMFLALHFQKLCKSIVAAPEVDRNKNWHDMFHLWNARVRTSVATARTNTWPHITCNFCELNKTCWHFACAPVGSMFQSHGCSKCAPAATYVGVQISITLLLRELRIIKTKQHWGFGMGLTLGFVCRPVERT